MLENTFFKGHLWTGTSESAMDITQSLSVLSVLCSFWDTFFLFNPVHWFALQKRGGAEATCAPPPPPPPPPPSITFSHVNLPFAKLLGLCPRPHLARFTYLSPNTLRVPYGPTRFSLRESYKWLFPSKVWDLPTALLKTHNFLRKIERTSLNLLELALFLDRSSTNYYKENINFLNFG